MMAVKDLILCKKLTAKCYGILRMGISLDGEAGSPLRGTRRHRDIPAYLIAGRRSVRLPNYSRIYLIGLTGTPLILTS